MNYIPTSPLEAIREIDRRLCKSMITYLEIYIDDMFNNRMIYDDGDSLLRIQYKNHRKFKK